VWNTGERRVSRKDRTPPPLISGLVSFRSAHKGRSKGCSAQTVQMAEAQVWLRHRDEILCMKASSCVLSVANGGGTKSIPLLM
jgi:hypothetical protein